MPVTNPYFDVPLRSSLPYQLLDSSLIGAGGLVNAAVADAKAKMAHGGRIILPPGTLTFDDGFPSFAQTSGYALEGAGGLTAGATPQTTLTYTGSGVRGIDARSSIGFQMRDLMCLYNNAAFAGSLVDFSHSVVADSDLAALERMYMGGAGGIRPATALVSLDNAIGIRCRDIKFSDAQRAIQGRAAPASYSNMIVVEECEFRNLVVVPIAGGGQVWKITGNIFEPRADGTAGAYSHLPASGGNAISFEDNWFGDATAAGTWIDWSGVALRFVGNYIATGAVAIALAANTDSADITGNEFDTITTGITAGAGCIGLRMHPNMWNNVATRYALTDYALGSELGWPLGNVERRAPRSRLYLSANLAVVSGVMTTVPWDSVDYDDGGQRSGNELVAQSPGTYIASVKINWSAGTTGQRQVYLYVNDATEVARSVVPVTANNAATISVPLKLNATDYITARVEHTEGSNVNVNGLIGGSQMSLVKIA